MTLLLYNLPIYLLVYFFLFRKVSLADLKGDHKTQIIIAAIIIFFTIYVSAFIGVAIGATGNFAKALTYLYSLALCVIGLFVEFYHVLYDKVRMERDILQQIICIEAEKYLKREPFEELGFAKLDTHRKIRSGFAEVVFCSGKADGHLLEIFRRLYEQEGEVLGTRASGQQYELLKKEFPQICYDPVARILKIEKPGKEQIGRIAVCTAGTADIPVAEEAAQSAEFFGSRVERIYDVGVSGIHRLLSRTEQIQSANCVVAVAGMEGALASVIGGMVEKPVIAVPTSVGYGASFHGLSALLTMINSCANGIAVVNIYNGYGAGYLATQINRIACKAP